eukprot:6473696-Amphidinium_carterae.1
MESDIITFADEAACNEVDTAADWLKKIAANMPMQTPPSFTDWLTGVFSKLPHFAVYVVEENVKTECNDAENEPPPKKRKVMTGDKAIQLLLSRVLSKDSTPADMQGISVWRHRLSAEDQQKLAQKAQELDAKIIVASRPKAKESAKQPAKRSQKNTEADLDAAVNAMLWGT